MKFDIVTVVLVFSAIILLFVFFTAPFAMTSARTYESYYNKQIDVDFCQSMNMEYGGSSYNYIGMTFGNYKIKCKDSNGFSNYFTSKINRHRGVSK